MIGSVTAKTIGRKFALGDFAHFSDHTQTIAPPRDAGISLHKFYPETDETVPFTSNLSILTQALP